MPSRERSTTAASAPTPSSAAVCTTLRDLSSTDTYSRRRRRLSANPCRPVQPGGAASPSRTAHSAAWVLELRPSLARMLLTCVLAVRSLITSSPAICLLALPCATSTKISRSRGSRCTSPTLGSPHGGGDLVGLGILEQVARGTS